MRWCWWPPWQGMQCDTVGVEDHLGVRQRVQDATSTTEGMTTHGFDFSLMEVWRLTHSDVVAWRSSVGCGGCRRRVWVETYS
jgi:hypothetical protein